MFTICSPDDSWPLAMPLEKVESLPQPLGQQREREQSFKPFLFVGLWSECRKSDHTPERPKRDSLSTHRPSIADLFGVTDRSAAKAAVGASNRRPEIVRPQETSYQVPSNAAPAEETQKKEKCLGDRDECRVPVNQRVYSDKRLRRTAGLSRRPSIADLFGATSGSGSKKTPPKGKWSPDIPPELEISFVASSLAAPTVGTQHREVSCRGRDGEQLPFRLDLFSTVFLFLQPILVNNRYF